MIIHTVLITSRQRNKPGKEEYDSNVFIALCLDITWKYVFDCCNMAPFLSQTLGMSLLVADIDKASSELKCEILSASQLELKKTYFPDDKFTF